MEPQLIDFYNDEPHGVSVIDKLNEEYEKLSVEKEKLQKEYDSLKHSSDVINSEIKHLRLPCIPNTLLIEEFQDYITSIFQSIEDELGTERVLPELCNSMTEEKDYELGANSIPTEEYYTHIYEKLNQVTGKKNLPACKRYIGMYLCELASEHLDMICPVETIVEKLMEDLYYWFDHCDSKELLLL